MLFFVLKAEQVPAFERILNEKVSASSIVSSANNDYAKNKNKGNLSANTKIRFATYNVLFGLWAKPESVGKMFKPYNLDVICFNEVPHGNWTLSVGRELGMKHVHVGKVSSANHKDKYKSILSRFPLRDKSEVAFDSKGWKPASVVTARTNIKGVPLILYSTHIPGQPDVENSAASFISKKMLSDPHDDNLFVLGDFNNLLFEGALKAFKEAGMKSIWHGLSINTDSISTHRHIESGNESGVIDHIFYRSTKIKVKVTNGGVIEKAYNSAEQEIEMDRYKKEWLKYGKPLSDHRPIWAEFTFMHD